MLRPTEARTDVTPFTGTSRTLSDRTGSSLEKSVGLGKYVDQKDERKIRLDEFIDVNKDLEVFSNRQLDLLKPKKLYSVGDLKKNTGLFRSYFEGPLSVLEGQTSVIPLLSSEAFKSLQSREKDSDGSPKYRFVHLGLIILGVKGLVRRELGTKVILCIYDSRWATDMERATIAITEVDLNKSIGIFYCSPDYTISIKDVRSIKVGIQTKGFTDFIGDNINICLGFLGKMMHNDNVNFKVKTNSVVSAITSKNKGIQLIEPKKFSAYDLAGGEWDLSKFSEQDKHSHNTNR